MGFDYGHWCEWIDILPRVATEVELPQPYDGMCIRTAPKRALGNKKGVSRLKRDILDDLGGYEVYIKRLRKHYPDVYKMFRRVGAYIVSRGTEESRYEIEPHVVRSLPGFGAIAVKPSTVGDDEEIRGGRVSCRIRFAFFTKLDRPGIDIQKANGGAVYRCAIYYDNATNKIKDRVGSGQAREFAVCLMPDGVVHALRLLQDSTQVIRHRHGDVRTSHVQQRRWRFPEIYAKDKRADLNMPLDAAVKECFVWMLNFWSTSARHSMIRITAMKGNIVMPFVVDATDTPSFFADREHVIDAAGRKKRIFHVVRPHVRTKSGVTRGVKLHFSGLREFEWHGYKIAISVPGKEHADINDFNVGVHEDVPEDERGGMMEFNAMMEEIGRATNLPVLAEEPDEGTEWQAPVARGI